MTTFLLDTNIIVDALNARGSRIQQLAELTERGALLACTSINVTEVYMGMRPHEAAATEGFLRLLEFYSVTWDVARLAGQFFNEWRQKGHTLALADVTIAAVCVVNGLTLLTDNAKHFPMPQLRLHSLPCAL